MALLPQFKEIVSENCLKYLRANIHHKTKKKNYNDEFHRVVVIDKSEELCMPIFNKDLTVISIENMTLHELKICLISLLEDLESSAKGKIYLIRLACGLSTFVKKFMFENIDKCCKNCRIYLPLKLMFDEIQRDLESLISEIEKKFYKAKVIPTYIIPFNIEDMFDELVSNHISCCSHLFTNLNNDFIIADVEYAVMQKLIDSNIKDFNLVVRKICEKNNYQQLIWSNQDEMKFETSIKERELFYMSKIEELLHLDFSFALNYEKNLINSDKNLFHVDATGTIELGIEDFEFMEKKDKMIKNKNNLNKELKKTTVIKKSALPFIIDKSGDDHLKFKIDNQSKKSQNLKKPVNSNRIFEKKRRTIDLTDDDIEFIEKKSKKKKTSYECITLDDSKDIDVDAQLAKMDKELENLKKFLKDEADDVFETTEKESKKDDDEFINKENKNNKKINQKENQNSVGIMIKKEKECDNNFISIKSPASKTIKETPSLFPSSQNISHKDKFKYYGTDLIQSDFLSLNPSSSSCCDAPDITNFVTLKDIGLPISNKVKRCKYTLLMVFYLIVFVLQNF